MDLNNMFSRKKIVLHPFRVLFNAHKSELVKNKPCGLAIEYQRPCPIHIFLKVKTLFKLMFVALIVGLSL